MNKLNELNCYVQ